MKRNRTLLQGSKLPGSSTGKPAVLYVAQGAAQGRGLKPQVDHDSQFATNSCTLQPFTALRSAVPSDAYSENVDTSK